MSLAGLTVADTRRAVLSVLLCFFQLQCGHVDGLLTIFDVRGLIPFLLPRGIIVAGLVLFSTVLVSLSTRLLYDTHSASHDGNKNIKKIRRRKEPQLL